MLTILHTNDLHNSLGMLPRLAALIARERGQAAATLLLDAGDAALAGRTADLGVQLLAALGYDALTPGNAENDVLEHRAHLARVGAPIVVANIAAGALGCATRPYLVRHVAGLRVAIVGLTTPPVYPHGHPLHRPNAQEVPVDDAMVAARRWVAVARAEADLVVVVSHLGLRRDVELALAVPGIHLIIGGHSHHRLPSPVRLGATSIVQAGIGGAYLGVVEVSGSPGAFQVAGRLEPVWRVPGADAATAAAIRTYLRQRLPEALDEVGETAGCWADPWQENPWANFVTESLRAAAGVDICFYKAGGLSPAADPGPTTLWDLWRCLPGLVANEAIGLDGVVAMTLTGEEVCAVCEHGASDLPWDLSEQISRRFCWPGNNLLHAAGLRMTLDLTRPPGRRVVALSAGGAGVEPRRRYTVATSGFLAKGYSGFTWLREGAARRLVGGERQLLLAALGERRELPANDGRLQMRFG